MIDEREDKPSASSMRRTRLCPGSVALIRRLKEDGTISRDGDDSSREGTARHSLIELDFDANTIEDSNTAYTVERAKQLLDEARLAARINGCETFVVREHRYWIYNQELKRVASAKLDHAEKLGRTGLVVDYKTLFGDHGSAASSEQMATQVVAFAITHGLDEVYAALIQPNLPKDRQLTVVLYDRPAIVRAETEVLAWCAAAEKPDAPRIPGHDQCLHCPARGVHCSESVAAALALTTGENSLSIPPHKMEEFLDRAKQAEAIIAAVREQAKKMLADNPEAFGTYALEPGRVVREITDANAAYAVAEKHGVSVEEYRSVLKAPLGAIGNLVASKAESGKGLARKRFEDDLSQAGLISTSQNKPSLVKKK